MAIPKTIYFHISSQTLICISFGIEHISRQVMHYKLNTSSLGVSARLAVMLELCFLISIKKQMSEIGIVVDGLTGMGETGSVLIN